MNNLQRIFGFASQAWSNPIKLNQGKRSWVWMRQCGAVLLNLYQTGRDYECGRQPSGFAGPGRAEGKKV
jgi:hypothetical protein